MASYTISNPKKVTEALAMLDIKSSMESWKINLNMTQAMVTAHDYLISC